MSTSVGEQLKEVRTARGLTLEQAAQATKIRKHYLEALERDDRTTLPSAVQGKGFLRLYAGYLGLDAEALAAQWEGKPLPVKPASPAVVEVNKPAPEKAQPVVVETPPPEPEEAQPEPPTARQPAGDSETIFREIGESLRKQRETLSLSLSEVERYTRLRQRYLVAMEKGHLDDLPSPVQGRGMISNYANFLNLDGEAVLLRFAEGLQLRRLERAAPVEEPGVFQRGRKKKGASQASALRRLLTPDLLIVSTLILALFVFIIWTAARISATRSSAARSTLPSVGEVLMNTTPGANPQETSSLPAPAVTSQSQPGSAPSNATEGAPAGVTQGGGDSSQPLQLTATIAPINSDPVQLYIVARQRAYLQVIADGQVKFLGRVVPGNAYPFSGKKNIELVIGNAAAFQIFYNQTDLGSLGVMGQVLRMTFTANGITTPTPMPTLTASPTKAVTPTFGPTVTVTPSPSVTPLVP